MYNDGVWAVPVKPCLILMLVVASGVTAAVQAATGVPEVRVDGGRIVGKQVTEQVIAYLGVPYAAPPVGRLRWREPQPVPEWSGVRDATAYGASCMQATPPRSQPPMSEDCLFLNLWTTVRAKLGVRRPVLVYLHGAGFNSGSASQAGFSGETLAQHGLVVVNMNYRLGVMGGLALAQLTAESPHRSSGNYQYLDQLAALRWVQRNIEQFGGDPGNVTLMGQSSGAIDVAILQASPLARGLFNRVLALSGSGVMHGGAWPAWPLEEAERQGMRVLAATGARSMAELRAMPARQIITHASFYFPVGAEGYVLQAHPAEIFAAGKQNDVTTFIGNTRDEGFSDIAHVGTREQYIESVRKMFGGRSVELLQLYPAATDEEAQAAAGRLANDGEFGKQMTQWARLQAGTGKMPAYLFVFAGAEGPAPHGRDVAFWFGRLEVSDPRFVPPTVADRALSEKMVGLIVRYATSGLPDSAAISAPRYDRADELLIELGDRVRQRRVNAGVDYFLDHPDLMVGIGANGRSPLSIH